MIGQDYAGESEHDDNDQKETKQSPEKYFAVLNCKPKTSKVVH